MESGGEGGAGWIPEAVFLFGTDPSDELFPVVTAVVVGAAEASRAFCGDATVAPGHEGPSIGPKMKAGLERKGGTTFRGGCKIGFGKGIFLEA